MLALLLLWLLVGPRIELPGLRGLRAEDLVFVALAALCVLHLLRAGRVRSLRALLPLRGTTVAIGAVAATGLISAAVATARGMVDPLTSVLFAVRPLEYWIAFPAALLLLRSDDSRWTRRIDVLLVIVTVLQTTFAVMQYYFGLQIGFSHAAYTRAAGLTVGPYELGAISATLVVYWIAHGRWTMASIAAIALFASISRISILGAGIAVAVLAAGWVLHLLRRVRGSSWRAALRPYRRPRLVAAGQVVSVATAAVVLAFTVGLIGLPEAAPQVPAAAPPSTAPIEAPSGSLDAEPSEAASARPEPPTDTSTGPQAPSDSIDRRLASTSVLGSWNAARTIAARVPHAWNAAEYQFSAYTGMNIYLNVNTAADAGIEASNLVRFFRWNLILDTVDDPADVVFGLGPSFVGPSVDGSYLRFFADGGLLGVLAWLLLIVTWLRKSPFWMICVTISLSVGALFIDIVYAERPMALFWLLLAVSIARRTPATTGAPPRV